jgi:hypothetical protein
LPAESGHASAGNREGLMLKMVDSIIGKSVVVSRLDAVDTK